MKKLQISVSAVNDGEEVTTSFIIQESRNGSFSNVQVFTVVSGTPEAVQTLLLADNQRLMIEGHTSTRVVYDKAQSAAVRVPVAPPTSAIGTDGDESPPTPAVERAMHDPNELGALLTQEDRDRMLTAARHKANPPPQGPIGSKAEVTRTNEGQEVAQAQNVGQAQPPTTSAPPSTPASSAVGGTTNPNLPSWARPVGGGQ